MSRSFALALTVATCVLACCTAQDDKRNLETSITRLEQRLERMDEFVKSVQTGQVQQQQEREKLVVEVQAEVARLRDAMAAQEKELARARQDREHAQAELAVVKKQGQQAQAEFQAAVRQDQQKREQAERQLRSELEASRQKQAAAAEQSEKLRRQAAATEQALRAQHELAAASQDEQLRTHADVMRQTAEQRKLWEAQRRDQGPSTDRDQAIARLGEERREVQRLREAVAKDLALAQQRQGEGRQRQADMQSKEMQALRDENEGLRRKLRAIEMASTPAATPHAPHDAPAPSTIIVNNGEGEVHFHFHGGTPPNISHHTGPVRAEPVRARAPDGPGAAGPSGPNTAGPSGPRSHGPDHQSPGPQGPGRAPQGPALRVRQVEPDAPVPVPQKPRAKDQPPQEVPASELRIHDAPLPEDGRQSAPLANFVQVLFGKF